MSSNPDDKSQGQAGEGKRPYATIDLKATEVETPPSKEAATDAAPGDGERQPAGEADTSEQPKAETAPEAAPARKPALGLLTHVAAGILGAGALFLFTELFTSSRDTLNKQTAAVSELTRRLGDLEKALGGGRGAEAARTRLDDLSRSVAGLGDAQARLAAEAKALDARVGAQDIPPGLAERLTKIDEILATVPVPGGAGREPSPAAKALLTRVDGELSDLRTETGRLAQRIDTLRGEVDERLKGAARTADVAPLASRVAAMEKDVQTFARGEADRNANASRIVLLLELGNLKRALDSGKRYATELAAVRKVSAGAKLDLAPLERYATEGVPPLADLAKDFRRVANKVLDAETEAPNATIVDRLVSGAKSVVRVRKSGHAADDTSAEATIGRMEAALKEGRLAEVLEQGKKLPPKGALAAEDWLKKVQARHTVDAAVVGIETALKTSLGEAKP